MPYVEGIPLVGEKDADHDNPTMIAYGIYIMTMNLTMSGCVVPNLLFRIFVEKH